jgi:predicted acetyltransferase
MDEDTPIDPAAIRAVDAARADMPIIQNLVRFYVYDMSEYMGWEAPDSGLFGGCDDLPRYWDQPGNHPFLIKLDEELVGFALIDGNPTRGGADFRVGEFFVLRKFRRLGIGERIARELFDRFRGRWHIEQLLKNTPARQFWCKVVARYTDGNFVESTVDSPWGPENLISFNNREISATKPRGRKT